MTWSLSKFRVGTLVEVRSKEEILATLDAQGCTDKLPFMPEMLRFCGQRFRVAAVAHKTCETAHQTWKARRIETAVHLDGTRCDGSAHGGCQADCNLFWKDSWLKPVEHADSAVTARKPLAAAISEADLMKCTRVALDLHTKEPVYSCQATGLFEATQPLAWWEPRQYARDVLTGNHRLRHVLSVLLVAFFRLLHQHAPLGYRATKCMHRWVHRQLFRRELPDFAGTIASGQPTPVNPLGLKPGERVRIKSKAEIEATLDAKGRNRGLYFDVELSSYC